MALISAKCTNCGANLEVDKTKDAAICPFCGSAYVVEKAINNYYTTNNIQAASINIFGQSADDLFRDAQTFTELEAYEEASQKYVQMMEQFPADPRGAMGVVRLAVEYNTPLSGGKTQLNPLKISLKLGDKEFLNWLYQNFERNEQVIWAGANLGPELSDEEFLNRLNQHFEKKCQRIRLGESSIEHEFGNGVGWYGRWDWTSKQLRLGCDSIPCVKALLDEAKANVIYFNSQIDRIGYQSYRKVAIDVIERMWAPKWSGFNCSSIFGCPLDGGIIGKTLYCEYDGSAGATVRFYDLSKVITKKDIDELFQEIMRINEASTSGCYIATAVYGSYDCPQVWTLRRFRDNTLAATWYGRTFIRLYYAVSPTLVKLFGHTHWFKKLWRGSLDNMVEKLQLRGVESSPYCDRQW